MYTLLRSGDTVICTCYPPVPPPFPAPPIPCPNGFVVEGSFNTFVEDKAVARSGDKTTNCCGGTCFCPNYILSGSPTVFVNDRAVARSIDNISCGLGISSTFRTFIG